MRQPATIKQRVVNQGKMSGDRIFYKSWKEKRKEGMRCALLYPKRAKLKCLCRFVGLPPLIRVSCQCTKLSESRAAHQEFGRHRVRKGTHSASTLAPFRTRIITTTERHNNNTTYIDCIPKTETVYQYRAYHIKFLETCKGCKTFTHKAKDYYYFSQHHHYQCLMVR